jgi:hypothetical protein
MAFLEAIRATRASTASTVQRTAVPAASARAILRIWSHTDRRKTMRLMTAAGLVLLCATTAAQTIPASEAAKHVGERGTVCGRIASEHKSTSSRGTPTFINLDKPYPNQVFTVLTWESNRAKVGAIPCCAPRARSLRTGVRRKSWSRMQRVGTSRSNYIIPQAEDTGSSRTWQALSGTPTISFAV